MKRAVLLLIVHSVLVLLVALPAAPALSAPVYSPAERRPAPAVVSCSEGPANSSTSARSNLEEVAADWGVYCEGSPTWVRQDVTGPSFEGTALRCGIAGGLPYSNVHCYRNLLPDSSAATVTLTATFQFSPTTTFDNRGGASVVQGLEFSFSKWQSLKRYELALQWRNVGGLSWRYWDPHATSDQWVDLGVTNTKALQLAGETEHTLVLAGEVDGGKVHYTRFKIDLLEYPLDLVVDPVDEPSGTADGLAVAVQLDGNSTETPYDLFIDRVNLAIGHKIYSPVVMR